MSYRVLCLGNNTELTDIQTRQLAAERGIPCHGLITELTGQLTNTTLPGFYHTSVYDVTLDNLRQKAREFGHLIVLPQSKNQYPDAEAFHQTIRVANELTNQINVEWIDDTLRTDNEFWEQLVKENRSFCIMPFIELLAQNGKTTVCCRSYTPVADIQTLMDFKTDARYVAIRNHMRRGERIPAHCAPCYELEDNGIISPRQHDTVEWANRLGLSDFSDLDNIDKPVYYEVRASNLCNLQCRTCGPECSSQLHKEYKRIGIAVGPSHVYTGFDIVDLCNIQKLYVSGGEPTIMPEFLDFLDHCIEQGKTDFQLLVNTNATRFNARFKKQLRHFSRFEFIVSIDGYDQLNHYIRWPAQWQDIIENVNYLLQNKNHVTVNTTVSIYNVHDLHTLMTFLDQTWPTVGLHLQLAYSSDGRLSAFNHPEHSLVLSSLAKCQDTKCYKNNDLVSNTVDALSTHYNSQPSTDIDALREFFSFNDRLDQSRNVSLIHYLPDLDRSRNLIT